MAKAATINGYLNIDKPAGMTSHDVVVTVRKALGERRVGHGGTLDPDATGVLVVGVGLATRLLQFLAPLKKGYVGEVVLGTATTTLDAAGQVTARYAMDDVTIEAARRAAAGFVGRIEQIPPMVSAVRVGGRRLYELARADGTADVERAPRPVEVYRFDVDPSEEEQVFRITVECSSGTYVRVLAAELGAALGGGAHLRALRRVAIGPYRVEDALALDLVGKEHVRPIEGLVGHLAAVTIDEARREEVAHGRVFSAEVLGASGPGPWAVHDEAGTLLAIYVAWRPPLTKPAVVFVTPKDVDEHYDPAPIARR